MNERVPGTGTESGLPVGASLEGIPPGDATAVGAESGDPLAHPRALQILTTEHMSLLATRSLSYNEAFTRAAMFLTFLSASLVVLGFLVAPLGLTPTMALVATVLLSADLFIGLTTLRRLADVSHEELVCVRGMNRIRHAYREMVPGLEPYFVAGFHDDLSAILSSYGFGRPGPVGQLAHGVATTPGMVGTIDAVLGGALAAVIALGLSWPIWTVLLGAAVCFLAVLMLAFAFGMRTALVREGAIAARFPTPTAPPE
jgi:hypothetical protein